MNKNLKKLAEDYGIPLDSEHKWPWKHNVEKMMEALVRECANVVFKNTGPKSALNVLEHFGVEE